MRIETLAIVFLCAEDDGDVCEVGRQWADRFFFFGGDKMF